MINLIVEFQMHLWCGQSENTGEKAKRQYIKSIRIVCKDWILSLKILIKRETNMKICEKVSHVVETRYATEENQ